MLLSEVRDQLTSISNWKPFGLACWSAQDAVKCLLTSSFLFAEEAEDPACIPIFWVSKWVDYSDKYGLGK